MVHWTGSQSLVGQSIQGFAFQRLHGEGPTTFLYEGEQTNLHRSVAMRLLSPSLAADRAALAEFLDAGRRGAMLIHAGIVPIFNVISDGALHFVVHEFVRDPSLDDLTRNHRTLSYDLVVDMAVELLDALEFAQSQNVVHGNISARNIFVSDEGVSRIADFCHSSTFTRATAAIDPRIAYMAPERVSGSPPAASSDVFSLGVCLFQAATGYFPYKVDDLMSGALGSFPPVPDASQKNPDVPPPLSGLLAKMLAWSAAERPQDLMALAEEWREVTRAIIRFEEEGTSWDESLPDPNKRKYRRLPMELDVQLTPMAVDASAKERLRERIANLSENGAYIPAPSPLPVGSFVQLEFNLDATGNVRVHALGVVRWVEETRASKGMGIQFVKVTTRDRQNLKGYVDDRLLGEMVRVLSSTPVHRKVLKRLLFEGDEPKKVRELMRGTGAGQSLMTRALEDFRRFNLVEIDGDLVKPVALSPRVAETLMSASRRQF